MWHDKIRVSWGHILPKYVHGDLLGYKVVYTLIKIAGKTIVQSKTDVKVVHPSITNVTIAGLQANAQYVFQILAFNAYGDGVRTTISYGGVSCALRSYGPCIVGLVSRKLMSNQIPTHSRFGKAEDDTSRETPSRRNVRSDDPVNDNISPCLCLQHVIYNTLLKDSFYRSQTP